MACQLRGTLKDISAAQFFHLIDLTKKTGTYHLYRRLPTEGKARTADGIDIVPGVRAGEECARIAFNRGMLVYATTTGPESHLPALLYKMGKLTAQQYSVIEAQAVSYGDKALALSLMNANYVKHRDIVQALRSHTLDIVYDTMTWTEELFSFVDDELPPADAITTRIDIKNIIADGTQRRLELNTLMQAVPSLDIALKFCDTPNNNANKIQFKRDEWHVISCVGPKRTVRQIAQELQMTDTEIRRIVAKLLRDGVVEPIGAAKPKPEIKPASGPIKSLASNTPVKQPDSAKRWTGMIKLPKSGLNVFTRKPLN